MIRRIWTAILGLALMGSAPGCVYAPGPYGYVDARLYDDYYWPEYPGNHAYNWYYGPWGVIGHSGLHHRGTYYHGAHRGFRGHGFYGHR